MVLAGSMATAANVTWDGSGDMTWYQPDSTDWSGATYQSGDTAEFHGAGLGGVIISGTVTPGAVDVNSAGDYVFSGGAIGGSTGLTKAGAGMLTLSSASSFTGSVLVNEGVVKIGNMYAFGARNAAFGKVIIASGAAVELNGIVDAGYGYTIAGSGVGGTGAIVNSGGNIGNGNLQTSNIRLADDATIGGTGNWALLAPGYGATTLDLAGHTLTKAGTNTFTIANATLTAGTIRIAGGTFSQYRRAHDAGAVAFTLDNTAGANLHLGDYDLTIGSLAGGGGSGGYVNLNGHTLTVGNADSTTFAGRITGGGGRLTKVGAGTLTLSASNDFTGSVTVNQGTLRIGNSRALGAADTSVAKVIVNSGGTVDLNGVVDAVYGYTIAGTGVGGAGALVNNGPGIGNNYMQSSNITLAADATIGGTGNFALLASGYGATTLDLAGHTLTKAGTNTFTIANATLTSGTIHIAEGTFSQHVGAHDASAVAFTLANTAGANLNLGSYGLTIGSLAGGGAAGGDVNLGGNTLTVGNAASTTYAGTISGGGRLTKVGAGTLTLGGANTYNGGTTISQGTLAATGTGAGGSASNSINALGATGSNVVVESNGTLTLTNVVSNWTGANYVYSGAGTINLVSSGGTAYSQLDGSLSAFTGTLNISGNGYGTVRNATDASQATVNVTTTGYGWFFAPGVNMQVGALTGNGNITGSAASGNATLTVGSLNTDTTFSGVISDKQTKLALTKVGAGSLTLSGPNTYTGATTISGGKIVMGNFRALGGSGNSSLITVAPGAALDMHGYSATGGTGFFNTLTIGGSGVGGAGALLNSAGGGGYAWNGNWAQNYNISLTADTLFNFEAPFGQIGSGYGETSLALNGYTLTKTGAGSYYLVNTTVGDGDIKVTGGSLILSKGGGGSTGSRIQGTGMITIGDGAGNGTLSVDSAQTAGLITRPITLDGGTIVSTGTALIDSPVTIAAGGGVLDGRAAYLNMSGPISGSGPLSLLGNPVWAGLMGGTSGYSGVATLTGNLQMCNAGGDGGSAAAAFVMNPGAVFLCSNEAGTTTVSMGSLSGSGTLAGSGYVAARNGTKTLTIGGRNEDSTFSGAILNSYSGGGSIVALTKVGTGTLALTGTNTFSGGVSLDGGVLSVSTLAAGNTPCALGASLGTPGNLVFNGGTLRYTGPTVNGINRAFTLNAPGGTIDIADPATTVQWTDASGAGPIIGVGGLTKTGPGTLWLASANTYGGGTVISQGALLVSNASALGGGAVTLNDSNTGAADTALLATTPMGIANAITVANQGSGTSTIGTTNYTSGANMQFNGALTLEKGVTLQAGSNDRTTFYGVIGGTGDVTITSPFANNRRIVFDRSSGAANSFVGDIYLRNNADLQLGVANPIGNRTIPDASDVYFASGSRLRFAPGGADNETIGALNSQASGAGTVDVYTGNSTFNLTIGSGDADGNFSGVIQDSSGTLNLIKTGAGTQVLSGTSGYVGATTVNEGHLIVDGSIASSSGVTVEDGATLGGSGYVPAVNVLLGGHVAPGSSFGTLHSGNTTFAAESFFDVEISPADWDLLDVQGLVALNGATLRLDPQASFSHVGGGQYTIIDTRGQVGGVFDGLPEGATLEIDGSQFAITYAGGADGFDVVLTAVPEPASALLVLLAAGGLGGYIRRRRA